LKRQAIRAAVMAALYSTASLADSASESDSEGLQEVIVTASHREVSAQNLPISITAVTGADLSKLGIQDMADLAHSMAGVQYTDKGPFSGVNGANLIIRGLNSETTSGLPAAASPVVPPVATYVDDTPLFFNLRLQDLERVEILRGPQGTLYGSGSLGGTVRFVQNRPDPNAFDAKVEASLSGTRHTSSPNGDVNGMLNIPFGDTFQPVRTGLLRRAGCGAARKSVQPTGEVFEARRQFLRISVGANRRAVETKRRLTRATVLLLPTGHGKRLPVCGHQPGRLQPAHQSGGAAVG
jgi:outer membrane receptor protein involved in Fe transport